MGTIVHMLRTDIKIFIGRFKISNRFCFSNLVTEALEEKKRVLLMDAVSKVRKSKWVASTSHHSS